MPDIPNRATDEADLASKIARMLQRQLGTVMEELGDPPNLDKLTPEFWQQIESETAEVIRPQIEGVFLEGAQTLLDDQPIGVDWGLVNERAVDWTSQYTFELVQGITNTTRDLIDKKVAQFFEEPSSTIRSLTKELQQAFGPVRAEMIAVTEVTRAAAEGQRQLADEIQKETGIVMIEIWQTADDDACPKCRPRHGHPKGDVWQDYPPLHVRCRCWVNLEHPAATNA